MGASHSKPKPICPAGKRLEVQKIVVFDKKFGRKCQYHYKSKCVEECSYRTLKYRLQEVLLLDEVANLEDFTITHPRDLPVDLLDAVADCFTGGIALESLDCWAYQWYVFLDDS